MFHRSDMSTMSSCAPSFPTFSNALSRSWLVPPESMLFRSMPNCMLLPFSGADSHKQHWTAEEEHAFVRGLSIYGKGSWAKIAGIIKTRTAVQVKNHAKTYFSRLSSPRRTSAKGLRHLVNRVASPDRSKSSSSGNSPMPSKVTFESHLDLDLDLDVELDHEISADHDTASPTQTDILVAESSKCSVPQGCFTNSSDRAATAESNAAAVLPQFFFETAQPFLKLDINSVLSFLSSNSTCTSC
eukprot:ANDGO_01429.mRNA.1 Myb-like protein H